MTIVSEPSSSFDNLHNFRDLGGMPASGGVIGPRRLYRSDSVAYLSAGEAERLVSEYALATVVDLRGDDEIARYGCGPLADTAVAYLPVPVSDLYWCDDRSDYYVAVLAERGDRIAAAIRRLTSGGAMPALVHCEAGCDRTGIFTAIVLDLVGVDDELICRDFALTSLAVDPINERLRRNAEADGKVWPPPDSPDGLDWHPTAEMMATTLERMRTRWGSGAGWAAAYGLTESDVSDLHRTLVVQD